MEKQRRTAIIAWLKGCLRARASPVDEMARARQLIAAIERGGIPLNPARVNAIARDLGLEVSRKTPVEETITRIRAAIARQAENFPASRKTP